MGAAQPHSFGELLKSYREAAGLTQEALAERAGLSVRGLSDLEHGRTRTPRSDTLTLLVTALELSARERALLVAPARGSHGSGGARARVESPPAARTARGAAPPLTPLVGRYGELDLLDHHLAGEGPPLLLLAGEPGIGKTRLLQEVAQRAVAQGLAVLTGGCPRRGGQVPYTPLLDALEQYIRGQGPLTLRRDLQGCSWLVRLLPELAEGPIPPLASETVSLEQERRLLFGAVRRFLTNVAGPAGTLLVLDDLQWAGSDALDLLISLVRGAAEAPLRVVGAYRDTEVRHQDPLAMLGADLAQAGLAAHQALGPLAADDAARLLDALLANGAGLDHAVAARVLRRASGTPFFLVSYAEALRTGSVEAAEAVPWTLAQSVRQRVALLPPSGQEVVRAAAIVGRRALHALLVAVLEQPEEAVLTGLEAASQAGLLLAEGDAAYAFAHDLIREVVESDIGAARRALLHRRVAQALEAAAGATPIEALAFHYDRSGDRAKAARYLEMAGDRALAEAANAAAEAHYRALLTHLDALGRPHDAARAREKLGSTLVTMACYAAALEVLERAATLSRQAGDLDGVARITVHIASVHDQQGAPDAGVRCIEPLLGQLEAGGASRGLARLYTMLARLRRRTSKFSAGLAASERAAALARTLGDERLLAEADAVRGNALFVLGRVVEARDALEEARRRAEDAGDRATVQEALSYAADVYYDLGQFAAAYRCVEAARQDAERRGDVAGVVARLSVRGHVATCMGEWERGQADCVQAVTLSRTIDAATMLTRALLNLGRHHLHSGGWDEAVRPLHEALALAERSGDVNLMRWAHSLLAERDLLAGEPAAARACLAPLVAAADPGEQDVTWLLPLLAWAELELGAVDAARELVTQAAAQARERTSRLDLVEALWVQALVALRREHWKEAARSLREGLALARDMPFPYLEARLLHLAGHMHLQQGEPEQARERLEAARALFKRLGARRDAAQVMQTAASLL